MTKLVHKKPCSQCPFRRASAPGWLGACTPEEFLVLTSMDEFMPCHKEVNYERKDWKKQLPQAPHCAGSLIFLRNIYSLPINKQLADMRNQVEPDRTAVFSKASEFLEHHNKFKKD